MQLVNRLDIAIGKPVQKKAYRTIIFYIQTDPKDWLSRRQRQKQGIERAHNLGKYRGKQADQERHQKVLYYRQVKKLSIRGV